MCYPPEVPICGECGKPMMLLDLHAAFARLGTVLTNEDSRYVIQCCGYERMIEDNESYRAAVQALIALGSYDTEEA